MPAAGATGARAGAGAGAGAAAAASAAAAAAAAAAALASESLLGGGSGRIEGELSHAITHQKNEFKVIALDEAGRPKGAGGDECVVHVHRCGEVVRVKTSDNGDGSYAVSFNPDTSGEYSIDISVGGVPLTGSPFSCQASTRTPHPPNCLVSGEALRRAVSREQQYVGLRTSLISSDELR